MGGVAESREETAPGQAWRLRRAVATVRGSHSTDKGLKFVHVNAHARCVCVCVCVAES